MNTNTEKPQKKRLKQMSSDDLTARRAACETRLADAEKRHSAVKLLAARRAKKAERSTGDAAKDALRREKSSKTAARCARLAEKIKRLPRSIQMVGREFSRRERVQKAEAAPAEVA